MKEIVPLITRMHLKTTLNEAAQCQTLSSYGHHEPYPIPSPWRPQPMASSLDPGLDPANHTYYITEILYIPWAGSG